MYPELYACSSWSACPFRTLVFGSGIFTMTTQTAWLQAPRMNKRKGRKNAGMLHKDHHSRGVHGSDPAGSRKVAISPTIRRSSSNQLSSSPLTRIPSAQTAQKQPAAAARQSVQALVWADRRHDFTGQWRSTPGLIFSHWQNVRQRIVACN